MILTIKYSFCSPLSSRNISVLVAHLQLYFAGLDAGVRMTSNTYDSFCYRAQIQIEPKTLIRRILGYAQISFKFLSHEENIVQALSFTFHYMKSPLLRRFTVLQANIFSVAPGNEYEPAQLSRTHELGCISESHFHMR